jgi:tellurite resistance protein TerC
LDDAMTGTPLLWGGFAFLVLAMLALDLFVFNKKAHEVRMREAVGWSVTWILLSLAFGVGVTVFEGHEKGLQFVTGWLIEKALSVDNLFVFLAVFSYFKVARDVQHKVLFWGVLGALVMRAIFVFIGSALLHAFEWLIYVFGAFLIATAWKLARSHGAEVHPEHNLILKWAHRIFRSTKDYHADRFFVRDGRLLRATPLFFVLVFIEFTDVMFAVDSVPAVFAVTTDTFIVYTSNVFAILGLRALYFVLAGSLQRFSLLHFGLAAVLAFVGAKMLAAPLLASVGREIPVLLSLGIIAVILAVSIAASLWATRRQERAVERARAEASAGAGDGAGPTADA